MANRLDVYTATHVGHVRARNEDRCSTTDWQASGANEIWQGSLDRLGGWLVVADGMGGHGAGEIASETAVRSMAALLPLARSPSQLGDAIRAANYAVHDAMSSPGGQSAMGTTIVGIRLGRDVGAIFNVGDSRAYLLRDHKLRMLSVDHTPTSGRTAGLRSHALTQSLGGTLARRILTPHLESFVTMSGDKILLCSDGLTDLVDDDQIAAILGKGPAHPAAALVAAALDAGGRDNVTVAIVIF